MEYYIAKLRTAHYNRYNLLVLEPIWITAVILEPIHASSLGLRVWGAIIGAKPVSYCLLTQDNSAYRMVLYRRSFFQVSALSTIVGSLLVYHGVDG